MVRGRKVILVLWLMKMHRWSFFLSGLEEAVRLGVATVGGTVLFALFTGVAAFVPHLLAEGVAWVWVSGNGPGRWLRRLRLPRLRRRGRFEVIRADRDPDRNWLD